MTNAVGRMKPWTAVALSLLGACATPGAPRAYMHEDSYARYYAADSGQTLRVERDGTVLDVTCLPIEVANDRPRAALPLTFCGGVEIPVLGKAARRGDDWDMSAYGVRAETGRCKPLFGAVTMDPRDDDRRRSCWNRLWEVPTAAVVVPLAIGVVVAAATAPVWVPLLILH